MGGKTSKLRCVPGVRRDESWGTRAAYYSKYVRNWEHKKVYESNTKKKKTKRVSTFQVNGLHHLRQYQHPFCGIGSRAGALTLLDDGRGRLSWSSIRVTYYCISPFTAAALSPGPAYTRPCGCLHAHRTDRSSKHELRLSRVLAHAKYGSCSVAPVCRATPPAEL